MPLSDFIIFVGTGIAGIPLYLWSYRRYTRTNFVLYFILESVVGSLAGASWVILFMSFIYPAHPFHGYRAVKDQSATTISTPDAAGGGWALLMG
jgi:hypothetical protein